MMEGVDHRVAAAATARGDIILAGAAGLAAGALSMAVGEYVSVSTQRDSEKALIAKEIRELDEEPEAEPGFVLLDEEFHLTLAASAGNPMLVDVLRQHAGE